MSEMYEKNNAIFLTHEVSKRTFKIREVLKFFSCDLILTDSIIEVVKFIGSYSNGFLIIDKDFKKYFPFVCFLMEDFSALSGLSVIFIDGNEDFYFQTGSNSVVYIINDKRNLYNNLYKIFYEENGRAKTVKECAPKIESSFLEEKATNLLLGLGFSQNYIGFNYIKDAICTMVKEGFKSGSLQKIIYSAIAIKYGTHVCNVQRNIRSAIESFLNSPARAKSKIPLDANGFTNRSLLLYLSSKVLEKSEELPKSTKIKSKS